MTLTVYNRKHKVQKSSNVMKTQILIVYLVIYMCTSTTYTCFLLVSVCKEEWKSMRSGNPLEEVLERLWTQEIASTGKL